MTSEEAKDRFAQLLECVDREPVAVIHDGRAAAFVVSPEDMEELIESRLGRKRAAAEFKAWSAMAKERATPEAAALTDEEVNRLVHELR